MNKDVKDNYKELKAEFPKMSDYELMSLALQMERNGILSSGFAVSGLGKYPPALEAIAMQLGYTPHKSGTITDYLGDISNSIGNLKEE